VSQLVQSLVENLQKHARQRLLVGADELSFADLEADARALCAFLALKRPAGGRLLLVTRDDRVLLTSFCAALMSGLTSVILDPRAPVAELAVLISAAKGRGIVADTDVLSALMEAGALDGLDTRLPVVRSDKVAKPKGFRLFRKTESTHSSTDDFANILRRHKTSAAALTRVADEEIAYILFTSGTTSKPKGVMISHRALYAQMQTFIRNYGLSSETSVMNLLPFHHTDGLTQGAVMCLLSGSTFVRPYAFTPHVLPQLLTDLYKYAVTHLVTVPSVLALTRSLDRTYSDSFDYPEFRFVISTAAFLDPKLWQSCEERFRVMIVNVYGLTETVCETMYCGPRPEDRRMGSVGRPIDSKAKIVDENDRALGDEEEGELLVAGDHIMTGYFNNPEATAAVLKDGWFRTGDIAKRDRDGFYYIVGRKKDLIISGGMNIYPEDVNGVLRSIPGVVDAVTFGLPDDMWGERAVSCIICDNEFDPSIETITAEFLKRASRQKLPQDIVKFSDFPRGPAGKVVMNEVKALYARLDAQDQTPSVTTAANGSVPGKVFSIAARILRCNAEELTEDSEAESVTSWTSLRHVQMMLAMEEAFGFRFSPREIMRFRSLGDAINIVNSRQGG
jgi:long-chain acyl-CoA synthetase